MSKAVATQRGKPQSWPAVFCCSASSARHFGRVRNLCVRNLCVRNLCVRNPCVRNPCVRNPCVRNPCVQNLWDIRSRCSFWLVHFQLMVAQSLRPHAWAVSHCTSLCLLWPCWLNRCYITGRPVALCSHHTFQTLRCGWSHRWPIATNIALCSHCINVNFDVYGARTELVSSFYIF